jgi:hypothetical protein
MVHHIMQAANLASFVGSWNFHFFIPLLSTRVEVTAEDDGNVMLPPNCEKGIRYKEQKKGSLAVAPFSEYVFHIQSCLLICLTLMPPFW